MRAPPLSHRYLSWNAPSPRGAAAAEASPASPAQDAGNLATQRLLSAWHVRTKPRVGRRDDPDERVADRFADATAGRATLPTIQPVCAACAGGDPCGSCATPEKTQREVETAPQAATRPAIADAAHALDSGGRPLSPALRADFEPVLGRSLADVRVHDDGDAAASAHAIHARAYAHGNHIAFAAGQFAPDTAEGHWLLAHELAHVAQSGGAIRRQPDEPNMTPADANQSIAPPQSNASSLLHEPIYVAHEVDFDPCAVQVAKLTNYELIAEYYNAMDVVNLGRNAPGFLDYRNLARRLVGERDRRVGLGHAWLATFPAFVPETLYQIVDGVGGTFQVMSVAGGGDIGCAEALAAPLMTQDQFDKFLSTHNVERVDADTYLLRTEPPKADSAQYGSLFATGGLFNAPQNGFLPQNWNPLQIELGPPVRGGALPDVFNQSESFRAQPKYMQMDMLLNPPPLDPAQSQRLALLLRAYRGLRIVPSRVDPLGVSGSVEGGTAAFAVTDIPGLETQAFPGASANALPAQWQGKPGTSGGSTFTAVNPTADAHAEHVSLENVRAAIDEGLRKGTLTRESLRGRTVFLRVEQEPCSSCASGAGDGAAGVLQQFAERYPELTLEVRAERTSRAFLYRNGQLLNPRSGVIPVDALTPTAEPGYRPPPTPAELDAITMPELRNSLQYGEFGAAGNAGLQGAGVGGAIAVVVNGAVVLINPDAHPNWRSELAISGGLGAGGGGTGSAAEQLIISGLNRSMVEDVAATGASDLSPAIVGSAGRLGGGAVGAMFVEGVSIGLLEERKHSALEVTERVGRAAVLGAGSVWAGAAVGTAVGGPVGFIVGLGIGALVYGIANAIVPGGREDWDAAAAAEEAGCNRSVTPEATPPAGTHKDEGVEGGGPT